MAIVKTGPASRIVLPKGYKLPTKMHGGTLRTCRGVLIGSALNVPRKEALLCHDVVGELNRLNQRRLLGPRVSGGETILSRIVSGIRSVISFC
jgi:hypothetical protein